MSRHHRLLLALALVVPAAASAQHGPPPAPVDAATRTAVIASLADQLRRYYVFPDVAQQVGARLLDKNARGGYAADADADAFSDALSKDLRTFGQDGHFRVGFAPGYQPLATTITRAAMPPEQHQQMQREVASMGYGIQRVERLPGNVGYLELRAFGPTDMVGEALTSAMTLLSGTDALIIDLRRNGGGEPSTVAYLMSHFFAANDRRHLNDISTRAIHATDQYWTTPDVRVHYARPVYVLTSGRTFSGGEEFAYDMQTQRRATLVGETTGGGANPGDDFPIGHDFVAFIPTGRSINPVTHTNWEHVGVKPDVAVPAAEAEKAAHVAILQGLVAASQDADAKAELQTLLDKVQAGIVDPPVYTPRH